MFERYTEKARRVIFFSRYEAAQAGSEYIAPEHILLGICREGVERMPELRERLTAPLWRERLANPVSDKEAFSVTGDLPLANASKRILAYGAEEAERLSDRHIGSEHLLLGILRERGTLACEALEQEGITLERVRARLSENPSNAAAGRPGYPHEGTQFRKLLYNPASESLIVEITRFGRAGAISRISGRHRTADHYEPIGQPPENISYGSAVTCDDKPIVLFLSSRLGIPEDVLAYNLVTKELTVALAKESLEVEQPHAKAWIANLHSLSSDGAILCFTLAVEKGESPGADVEYWLARVKVGEKKAEVVTLLKDRLY